MPWLHLLGIARLRPAQRVPGRRGAGVDRVSSGRRGGAGRPSGRPAAEPALAAPRSRTPRRRDRGLRVRRHGRGRVRDRFLGDPLRARHDPADPGRRGRAGEAVRRAAAHLAVRRTRRGPAPHPHRPRHRRRGRHRGGRGGVGHRQHQRRGGEPRDLPGDAARG